jgi:cell pole-organizing protein PopZ
MMVESQMTQPAKVQEPSMEQILASIRRIIADDEAKPPVAEKPGTPSPSPAAAKPDKPVAPSASPAGAAVANAARSVLPPPRGPAPSVPAAGNSQDDVDALLAGLDETTNPEGVRHGEVFELTDAMAVRNPQQPSFQTVGSPDDVEFTESYDAPASDPPQPASSQPILSQSTISAVESAFDTLAHTVLNARTFDDLAREMLRPMLKSWLDDNLPALVERIVKAEIERVSRGAAKHGQD